MEAGSLLAVPELHLTVDQASSNNSAVNFLMSRFRLNGIAYEDSYHRSWNDFSYALNKSGLRYVCLQLWHPLNANYLPYGKGVFKQKKTEAMLEFERMYPTPPLEWFLDLQGMLLSGESLPTDEREVQELAQRHIYEHPDYKNAGPAFRLNSWYSIIPCIKAKDAKFLLWRRFLRWLSLTLMGHVPRPLPIAFSCGISLRGP